MPDLFDVPRPPRRESRPGEPRHAPPSQPAAASRSRESFEGLRSLVEGDLLPRLLLMHNAGPVPPALAARAASVLPGGEYDRFLKLILGRNSDEDVTAFLRQIVRDGHSLDAVYVDLLTPAARHLGVMWEEDSCDFVEVTLACCQMQRVIRRLGRRYLERDSSATSGSVLVETLAEEQHTLGAIIVAEVMGQTGWAVTLGQPFQDTGDIDGIDLFAFSLSRVDLWREARARIRQVRLQVPGVEVIVGGSAFLEEPSLVSRVEADAWAEDGRALKKFASGYCCPA